MSSTTAGCAGGKRTPNGFGKQGTRSRIDWKASEVMSPLAYAMGFVHNDGANVPMLMAGLKEGMSDALRDMYRNRVPKPNVVQHPVAVVAHPGLHECRVLMGLALVFHQHQGVITMHSPPRAKATKRAQVCHRSRYQPARDGLGAGPTRAPLMRPEGGETPVRFEE